MSIARLLMSTVLFSCVGFAQAAVTKDGNRVTVQLDNPTANGAKVVSLQVINDNIIRVQATSEAQLPQKQPSLMIVQQTAKPQFTTSEEGSDFVVKAKGITARVDKQSGRVSFFDAAGKQLASAPSPRNSATDSRGHSGSTTSRRLSTAWASIRPRNSI